MITLLLGLVACDPYVVKMGEGAFLDADGDGFGVAAGDCDDSDATVAPGNEEACDGVDQDCDGEIDEDPGQIWYADADGDGAGDPEDAVDACAAAGRVGVAGDCDDTDAAVRPGALEACDGVDNDCDGDTDEDGRSAWYADADGDGFGDDATRVEGCEADREGWARVGGDCDDSTVRVFPGRPEDCDGVDNDCDGDVDEDVLGTWYADLDGDGWGSTDLSQRACVAPEGHVGVGGDCNEADAAIYPGAPERCDVATDANCDGSISYADLDRDGFPACLDCDDTRADVFPGGVEVCGAADEDCDGAVDDADASLDPSSASVWYPDADTDGYGSSSGAVRRCAAPAGWRADSSDCDDGAVDVSPSATEVCNGLDDDCDGAVDDADDGVSLASATTWYADADADGYGDTSRSALQCEAPYGFVADATDCDDSRARVNPGANEECGGRDDDCDGLVDDADESLDTATATRWYADADADGYGDAGAFSLQCACPSGYVATSTDCDDGDPLVSPAGTEVCNDIDDDCDALIDDADSGRTGASTWYRDADADGYGTSVSTASCDMPAGYAGATGDCNDASATVRPGAAETCNATDDDCDGTVDTAASCGCVTGSYGGHAYLFCTSTSTWTNAQSWCVARGYQLASVTSAAENTYVVSQVVAAGASSAWTGGNDRTTEGRWQWSAGDSWSYTNWNAGEPNSAGNEDCVEMYASGKWNDVACGSSRAWVCETR